MNQNLMFLTREGLGAGLTPLGKTSKTLTVGLLVLELDNSLDLLQLVQWPNSHLTMTGDL